MSVWVGHSCPTPLTLSFARYRLLAAYRPISPYIRHIAICATALFRDDRWSHTAAGCNHGGPGIINRRHRWFGKALMLVISFSRNYLAGLALLLLSCSPNSFADSSTSTQR